MVTVWHDKQWHACAKFTLGTSSFNEVYMKPFVGYPGGKSRAAKSIISLIKPYFDAAGYCEMFGGGFSLGLAIRETWKAPMWINEYDPDMYSLWHMVLNNPDDLCKQVERAKITADKFYTLKERILQRRPFRVEDIPYRAIDKLIIHKISFSNMGEMSGSPVGGKTQQGKWKFDVRWNPESICKAIRKTSEFLAGTRLTRHSYERMFDLIPSDWLVYVDPPYVNAGPKCYKHSFTDEMHVDLAQRLQKSMFRWFATYDDCDLVRGLYVGWADVGLLSFKYFMSSAYRTDQEMKNGNELFITNW